MHKDFFLKRNNFFLISNTFGFIYIASFTMWYCVGEQWVHVVFVDILDPVCYELTKASTTLADETKSTTHQVTHTPTYMYNETIVLAGNGSSDVSSTQNDM